MGGLGGAGGGLGSLGGGAGSPFGTGKVLFVAFPFKIIYNKANSLNLVHGFCQILLICLTN